MTIEQTIVQMARDAKTAASVLAGATRRERTGPS